MDVLLAAIVIIGLFYLIGRPLLGILGLLGHTLSGLPEAQKRLLLHHIPYYIALSQLDRTRFEKRVKEFIYEKEWLGRGISITDEMKVRIAAVAVQLTFGMSPLLLLHFRKIVVRPTTYRNRRTGMEHVGEVILGQGAVVLAWDRFLRDEAIPNDGRNLGLHEMAHALWFEHVIPNAEDELFAPAAEAEWRRLSKEHIAIIRSGETHFLRDYAGTNEAEFFAVCVEYFFEQAIAFRKAEPELYQALVGMLKQDPAAAVC
ncbi:MAG: zinc-dependent peptidase [Flavobacteriales bacterium]|nr:zinc-dependent peptidase [Flavobacteriales bacterium]